MSLLLDALKKAALDKKTREQLHADTLCDQPDVTEISATPLVSRDTPAGTQEEEEKDSLLADEAQTFEPDPTEAVNALANSDEIDAEEFSDCENIDLENIPEFDNRQELEASPGIENDSPDLDLSQQTDSLRNEELTDETIEADKPNDIDHPQAEEFDFSLDPEKFEVFDETPALAAQTETPTDLQLEVEAPDPVTASDPSLQKTEQHARATPPSETTSIEPPLNPVDAPQEPSIDGQQAPSDAQKTAIQTLLQKNLVSANKERRRKMAILSAISLSAIAMIGFYYYYLEMQGNAVLTPPQSAFPTEPLADAPANASNLESSPQLDGSESASVEVNSGETVSPSTSEQKPLADEKEKSSPAPKVKLKNSPGALMTAEHTKKPVQASSAVFPSADSISTARSEELGKTYQPFTVAINRGYQAWQQGNWEIAEQAYDEALTLDPYHRDAMLGAAAVAVQRGRHRDALILYQQRLHRAPRDEYARAGLISLADPGNDVTELESEINLLLREFPEAAHLYFLKGSLQAAQQEWRNAQGNFFEAWRRDNTRADYVFNLGISMDHMGETKEALEFYRKALSLSERFATNFDVSALQLRIRQLEERLQ